MSVIALSIAAMILAYLDRARDATARRCRVSWCSAVLVDGSRYPLDMFWHIARTTPLTLLLALAGWSARARGCRRRLARRGERAAHVLWIGWVLWFGVIESGITTNYLLLPVSSC